MQIANIKISKGDHYAEKALSTLPNIAKHL
jgi:hypothetical protein